MQGDFKLHIVDPSIIVAPLANSAIEIQEEKKKEGGGREITAKSKQDLKKKFQELISQEDTEGKHLKLSRFEEIH
jgi:hypothetical protein